MYLKKTNNIQLRPLSLIQLSASGCGCTCGFSGGCGCTCNDNWNPGNDIPQSSGSYEVDASGCGTDDQSDDRDKLMDINCIHRSLYYLGNEACKNNKLDLSYWRMENLYNEKFNTNVIEDNGVKMSNVRALFSEYFVVQGVNTENMAAVYADKPFKGYMHANMKRPDGSYHSVVIKEINEKGKMTIFDPTESKHITKNLSDASSTFVGEALIIKGAKD